MSASSRRSRQWKKGDDKALKSSEETTGKELGISNIVFCSKNPKGHMAYEEQPEATYKLGKNGLDLYEPETA